MKNFILFSWWSQSLLDKRLWKHYREYNNPLTHIWLWSWSESIFRFVLINSACNCNFACFLMMFKRACGCVVFKRLRVWVCKYGSVCVYACVHTCGRRRAWAWLYVCFCVRGIWCVCVYVCVHIQVCLYMYVDVALCVFICMYVLCMHIYTLTCVYYCGLHEWIFVCNRTLRQTDKVSWCTFISGFHGKYEHYPLPRGR